MQVVRTYLPLLWYLVITVLFVQLLKTFIDLKFNLHTFYSNEFFVTGPELFTLGWKTMAILAFVIWFIDHRENSVYLLDFSCFQPPDNWRVSADQIVEILRRQNCFSEDAILFQERMLKQSGCGPKTAWPPGILQSMDGKIADRSIEASRKESEIVMYDYVRKVLEKTKTNPKDIDILVVNCSLFAPTPSLCSMIINEFGLRSDVSAYNLSGMVRHPYFHCLSLIMYL